MQNLDDNFVKELELQKRKVKRRECWIITLIIIIIFLICFFNLIINRLGKIGYNPTSGEVIDTIQITENDVHIEKIEDLNIFNNIIFNGEKKISPHSYGEYKFKIENTINSNITYNISMKEMNQHNINMKYKLKLDNIYIIGDSEIWKDVEDLNIKDIIVTANSRNIYTLEWYWEDSPNDTYIGELDYAEYKLNISIDTQNI